jgi:hypothetical protein
MFTDHKTELKYIFLLHHIQKIIVRQMVKKNPREGRTLKIVNNNAVNYYFSIHIFILPVHFKCDFDLLIYFALLTGIL